MQNSMIVLQLILAAGLLNVWLVRYNQKSAYRGGDAGTMRDEFLAYGLPAWSVYVVGALKLSAAFALIVGFWVSALVLPAATLIALLMIGAILMHAKIRDPLSKYFPAALMLLMSASVVFLAKG